MTGFVTEILTLYLITLDVQVSCERNKRMDKHERPYKCRGTGCELNPSFTFLGGLLRHQREVHKMHLSTKQALFCLFLDYNRNSSRVRLVFEHCNMYV